MTNISATIIHRHHTHQIVINIREMFCTGCLLRKESNSPSWFSVEPRRSAGSTPECIQELFRLCRLLRIGDRLPWEICRCHVSKHKDENTECTALHRSLPLKYSQFLRTFALYPCLDDHSFAIVV